MKNINAIFGDLFKQATSSQQNPPPQEGPRSQGMAKKGIDPALGQQKLEEVKFKQTAGGPQPAAGSGGGWFANLGKGFGTGVLSSGGPQKEEKTYKTCLTYMQSFQGKRVIMTGGTGGIGSKVAKKLLKAGAIVVMLVRDPTKVDVALNLKDARIKKGKNFIPITLNLGEPYQIEKKFKQALQQLDGHVDALILCHGYIRNESIQETNMLEWDQMMNLNVRTHFQLVSLATPFLKLSKGNITVLSSSAGETPQPGSIIYSTSMAMLNMLVQCASLETSYFGVRVNAVAPGVTVTVARTKKESLGISESENRKFLAEAAQDVPLQGKINLASDVAKAILWLASDEASFITGEILTVDGGQSLTSDNYNDYLKQVEEIRSTEGGGVVGNLFGGGTQR